MASSKAPWEMKPEEVGKQMAAQDQYEDCLACRITGSAAFMGLGVYSYYTGMRNLKQQEKAIMRSASKYKMGSRQLGIATLSASLIGVGLYRAFN
ncbi:hypothetical protein TMatcc_007112 [Talaromyces marneffei ATCC 18224]|uniref:Distal membrane-arm assembly complex protein 1-like domain-containing protein n=1 Tax=Talaromyces marneffei (strain ATCC 18224 / CBS 334.59 / QM 7333) TaxID=441960 RepID=B6QEU9_TALMQ|nr:uncharacterized protein EYB26_004098 [Talaromyces marneffei]EEA24036.1 conserved hypothetical protein [Talaromyces marneffei ATCC 18224]KAE8553454.1 hypothetical protein EYB25_004836 [Talaromyces marneffei]QGA16431.1 hypothetical protein EYB26_004098 [Talaromyces marneffei]